MHEPEIFVDRNKPSTEGSAFALKKHGHLINWSEDNKDTLLDIGCGPGNVLVDVFLPSFQGKFSIIYGTDVSENMIDYARKKYSKMENLQFMTLDIMAEVSDFVDEYGQVDHVLSTYVIQWLPDHPKGYTNIFNLLKPGGDFFSVHLLSSPYYDIFKHMDQNEKWSMYLDNLKGRIPFTHDSSEPENDLKKVLERVGFREIFMDVFNQDAVMDNYDEMIMFMKSILVQIDRIPAEKQMDYAKDFVDYGLASGAMEKRTSGEVAFPMKIVILYARK